MYQGGRTFRRQGAHLSRAGCGQTGVLARIITRPTCSRTTSRPPVRSSRHWRGSGHETRDPAKVAQLILRLLESDKPPAHLLLDSDAVQFATHALLLNPRFQPTIL